MMKRIFMLLALVLMLATAMALSGVAQAAPTIGTKADAKCLAEAAKTVEQPGFNPADYTFIGGTELSDTFTDPGRGGSFVFCGFGGDDSIETLDDRDIFLGGEGNDKVTHNQGTFYGGEGNDVVVDNFAGTFYGGPGDDEVGSGNPPVDEP
jgi:hypothetical protein